MDKLDLYVGEYIGSETKMFAQEYNKPDPTTFHRFMRAFDKVWDSLGIDHGEGERTTLMIDDEARKFREWPDNGIALPTFNSYDRDDNALLALISCLKKIESCKDIRKTNVQSIYDRCLEKLARPRAEKYKTTTKTTR
eukprot:gnl/Chilomastix_caulleri/2512.p1 GENE.gnl/Chilomastix_caulleri/2512~~gnl/Chilomastix_caulleri/2512.p1  ORF type:complete len:138 (-),score=15.02 gnl/Chilomastix_caulleri/2512:190-603(-)